MGNNQIGNSNHFSESFDANSDDLYLTYLDRVQTAVVLKIQSNQKLDYPNQEDMNRYKFRERLFLQKVYLTESEQEYKFMSQQLERESKKELLERQCPILKIQEISRQKLMGLCANRYKIRVLFEYSDITLRQQIKIRVKNQKQKTQINAKLLTQSIPQINSISQIMPSRQKNNSETSRKNYFHYEDLCSILYSCISGLFFVESNKAKIKQSLEQAKLQKQYNCKYLSELFNQYKSNISLNLDRIIIMQDGTVKILHPLVIDQSNTISHSSFFFYSPQKLKDFMLQDGIKGRIFQTALVVLQCALLENSQQMNTIYNGYCVSQSLLNQKINQAISIYTVIYQRPEEDFKLFSLIRKMTEIEPTNRIQLDQCIQETQKLFQLNKKIKNSLNSSVKQINVLLIPDSKERMTVQELGNSMCQNRKEKKFQNQLKQIKSVEQLKTTARHVSLPKNINKYNKSHPQVQISEFAIHDFQNITQSNQRTIQSTNRNAPQSLIIVNSLNKNQINEKNIQFFQSLIGKSSNLYDTQKYDLENHFQYNKFQFNSSYHKQIYQTGGPSQNQNTKKEFKYQNMLKKSNSSQSKFINSLNRSLKEKIQKQSLGISLNQSASRFMKLNQIYSKENSFLKSILRESSKINGKAKPSLLLSKKNEICQKNEQNQNKPDSSLNFNFSRKNLKKAFYCNEEKVLLQTNRSQVLQKMTSQSIYQKYKKAKLAS